VQGRSVIAPKKVDFKILLTPFVKGGNGRNAAGRIRFMENNAREGKNQKNSWANANDAALFYFLTGFE
jgi:hypothetical protein